MRWSGGESKTGHAVETGLDTYLNVNIDAHGKLWVLGRRRGQQYLLTFDGQRLDGEKLSGQPMGHWDTRPGGWNVVFVIPS